jgi:hypothetical protein
MWNPEIYLTDPRAGRGADSLGVMNAGTVAAVLDDLADLGELEVTGRTEGSGSVRYQRKG